MKQLNSEEGFYRCSTFDGGVRRLALGVALHRCTDGRLIVFLLLWVQCTCGDVTAENIALVVFCFVCFFICWRALISIKELQSLSYDIV